MRNLLVVAVVLMLSVGTAFVLADAEKTSPLAFPNHGFSIEPLDETAKGNNVVLLMFLPAKDGFAANVNVTAQDFEGTIEEYATISKDQFKQANWELLTSNIERGMMTLECRGESQGRALHWYFRAAKKGGAIYLVTATATQKDWPEQSARLKACANSFALLTPADPIK